MNFPDCEIHMMEQRSPEWHEIRKGKLTGSSMGAWLAERPKCRLTVPELKELLALRGDPVPPSNAKRDQLIEACKGITLPMETTETFKKARKKAVFKIMAGHSDCNVPDPWEVDPEGPPPRNPALWAVWNGMRLEDEALERFQNDTGLVVDEVGFCEHYSKYSGVSPDGLIFGQNVGFEGKAPLPETHYEYLDGKVLPEQYRSQVHGSMAVTGADAWWFQSYCPGAIVEVFRIKVERDEYTERMQTGLIEFAELAKEEIGQLVEESKQRKEVA